MNKLKFKAWDKVKLQMYNPLAITFDTQSLNPFAVSVPGRSWEPIHKYELLQYTGLLDKNGNEVYQGDLFNINSIIYKVVWNDSKASFELEDKNSSTQNISKVTDEEICGNMYQNTELII